MKRYQSRNISRSRKRVQALNPCDRYSVCAGTNPFAYIFQQLAAQIASRAMTEEEKKNAHKLKMKTESKSAIARKERKRVKV